MNKKDIAIATITWARDEKEKLLLIKALQYLAEIEIPVFITDGGSDEDFLDFLKSIPHFTLLKPIEKGLWPQAKTSLEAAYASCSKFIFYTEPDKLDFIQNLLNQIIESVVMNEQSGIILASRSKNSFASFPPFQQMTETTINNCCKEIIGKTFDYCYGPFLLHRDLVPFLKHLNTTIAWGWRPYIFGVANRLGYNTDAYTGDFFCPPEQEEDNIEERVYRMRQLTQSVEGLTIATTINLKDNFS